MKSYTSLEQSQKLAEILPIESADAYYTVIDQGFFLEVKQGIEPSKEDFPCWSLAALLDILPYNLKLVLAINDFQSERKEKYAIGSVEHDKYDCYADNPVDACYEMILKLNELKML